MESRCILGQSLGHCGTCHTPRGLAFQEKAYTESSPMFLRGAVLDNWFASNLTGDLASGLGRWSEADIAAFLATGHGGQITASGSMTAVVENSTQYLHKDDLNAIAHYLKSLPAHDEKALYKPDLPSVSITLSAMITGEIERPGAGLYHSFCVKCHKKAGNGEPGKFPKLAGNSSILSENATSLIHLLLKGGRPRKQKKDRNLRKCLLSRKSFPTGRLPKCLALFVIAGGMLRLGSHREKFQPCELDCKRNSNTVIVCQEQNS